MQSQITIANEYQMQKEKIAFLLHKGPPKWKRLQSNNKKADKTKNTINLRYKCKIFTMQSHIIIVNEYQKQKERKVHSGYTGDP